MSDTTATAFQNAIEAGKTKELKGVNGWLLLRVIAYLAWGPISLVATPSISGFILIAFMFVAGIYLLRLNPIGVKLAKIGEGLTIGLGLLLIVASPLGVQIGESNVNMFSLGLRSAISGTIWLIYFYRSKRVKNTYFPNSVNETPYEAEQRLGKLALKNAALAAVTQALKIGAITRTQAALIEGNMRLNPSLRNILEELITTLEANGEVAHVAAVREVDDQLFKECVSAAPVGAR